MAEESTTISATHMVGDLCDLVLTMLQGWSNVPWSVRSEVDRRTVLQQIEARVKEIVREAVELIAADGLPVIRGRLVKAAAKDVIQCQIDVMRSETMRHEIVDGIGSMVMLAIVDPKRFYGTHDPERRTEPRAAA